MNKKTAIKNTITLIEEQISHIESASIISGLFTITKRESMLKTRRELLAYWSKALQLLNVSTMLSDSNITHAIDADNIIYLQQKLPPNLEDKLKRIVSAHNIDVVYSAL